VGLSWNIFDSGVTNAQVKAAQTALDVAKLTLLKDQETVDYNLRQAYYNMREAEKRLNSTQDAVHQAEEDAFIAREKYRAGEGLMLDIIDAQEALSKARLNYISAQYDYARYKAAVENAMGMELTAEEKAAAAQLETNVDKVMAVPQTGAAPETSAASTRKVAEELAGNEVAK
jgi:outer membrane protein TolC